MVSHDDRPVSLGRILIVDDDAALVEFLRCRVLQQMRTRAAALTTLKPRSWSAAIA